MLKLLLCFLVALASVQAAGEFAVLHSPNSVVFHGNEKLEQSLIKEVMAASLGYTVKLRTIWNGMSIRDPFSLPEAVVAIVIDGVNSLRFPKDHVFPLDVNEAEETTWQALRARVDDRDSDNTLVRISLMDGLEALGQSSLGELKPTPIDKTSLKVLSLKKQEDKEFLEEVQLLRAIAKKVPSAITADSKSDVYWLVVSGLRPVFDAHGRNSSAAREAEDLLHKACHAISEAFVAAYDGKVMVAAFTNDASQVRHARAALLERQTRETKDKEEDIVVREYSEDYPVIFNILLWFGVVFVFSLLAICIAIADMDPGRDSIIYRMTSNRMKKDN